jgi:YihY family inner membrane protein
MRAMGVSERLDSFQRRHEWAGAPLAMIYKLHDDQGVYLAALIAFYGFLSVFPLLLLFTSILGFVLQNDPELQHRILDSTLRQFPVIGQQLGDPGSVRGSGIALVVSVLVAIYGALGVAHAIQHAMNVIWAVPRCYRPNPFHLRLRSLVLIAIGGLATTLATVLSGLASSAAAFGADLDWLTAVLIVLAAIVVNTAVFVVGFWICVPMDRSVRSLLPGALTAAVVWQALQLGGTAYVSRVVANNDDTYGAFALVLGLIAWIFLASLAIVFSAEIDVVRYKRLYPRSLLTPFTDNVELTGADRRTYTEIATAQRYKKFEKVTVSFTEDRDGVARERRSDAGERVSRR